jgi:hypothetical protein
MAKIEEIRKILETSDSNIFYTNKKINKIHSWLLKSLQNSPDFNLYRISISENLHISFRSSKSLGATIATIYKK